MSAPAGTTHVAAWMPPWLTGIDGYWEIRTIADFDAAEPMLLPEGWSMYGPRDVGKQHLESFAAEVLGFPASLTADVQQIRKHRRFGRYRSVPIFYVCAREVRS